MNPLLQLLLASWPSLVALIQERWAAAHPDQPVPTSVEITAGFEEAFTSSVMKDELIRAAHTHPDA